MSYIRAHLCQLHFWPAYFDDLGSMLSEVMPLVGKGERLGQLRHYPAVMDALIANEQEYHRFLLLRAEAAIAFAKKRSAQILVFPEYAIPVEVIARLRDSARNHQLTVIFGTHRTRAEDLASRVHAGWTFRNTSATPMIGSAICPILTPDGQILAIPKSQPSKWEPSLMLDECRDRSFSLPVADHLNFRISVFICIDALHSRLIGGQSKPTDTDAVIVTALTPSLDEFRQLGEQLAREETELLLCNPAALGGSFCHVHPGGSLFRTQDPHYPPQADVEAVVEVDLPISDPLRVRGTIRTAGARVHPRVFLASEAEQPWVQDYRAVVELVAESLAAVPPDLDAAKDALQDFVIDRGTTPDSIISRLRHARQRLDYYEGDSEDLLLALEPMYLDSEPLASFMARRISRARAAVNRIEAELRSSDDDVVEDISKNLRKAARRYPVQQVQPAKAEPAPAEIRNYEESTLAWFKGRGELFDKLEAFFRAGSNGRAGLLLTGLHGIGKTSSLRALFLKSFARLVPEWVSVPQDASFATILSRIAEVRGVRLDIDFLRTASRKVFLKQSKKLIEAVRGAKQGPLIVDDLGDMQQDSWGVQQFQNFAEELSRSSSGGSKIVFVCSRQHPYTKILQPFLDVIHVTPLTQAESDHALRWYLEKYGKSLGVGKPRFSPQMLQHIGGHPLALRMLAQTMTQKETNAALQSGEIPLRATRGVIEGLLPNVRLTASEKAVLNILAVLREPFSARDLQNLATSGVPLDKLLDEIVHKALADFDGAKYSIHSLFRAHFYEQIPESERSQIHERLATLYKHRVSELRERAVLSLPQMAELAYHLMGSGRLNELGTFCAGVASEALPLARRFYLRNKNNPVAALRKYELLAELLPEEPNVRAYVGRCYARMGNDALRDEHFTRAIDLARRHKQQVGWLYRDWGQIRLIAQDFRGCLECFELAREMGLDDASMLATEGMAIWRLKQDIATAAEFLDRAVSASPRHEYVLATRARVLREAVNNGHVEFSERLADAESASNKVRSGRYDLDSEEDWEIAGDFEDGELRLEG